MIPPHIQVQVEVLFKAGKLLIKNVGEPGAQGATVTGIQGIGTNTPSAAAVAVATTGFVGVAQSPKGKMFTMGT